MTDNEIRIAIAEQCGWKQIADRGKGIDRKDRFHGTRDGYDTRRRIPDYTKDLNACAEFERTLEECDEVNGEDQLGYMEMLAEVVGAKWGANNQCDMWRITHATAPQRCEAFLRVKGLWMEQ